MLQQPDSNSLSQLKQLWGEFIPSLTPEQAELSVKVWQKIKTRKQRQTVQLPQPESLTELE